MTSMKKSWESLCKKIKTFQQKFPESRLVVIGLVKGTYKCEGDPTLRANFGYNDVVVDKFKEAVRGATVNEAAVEAMLQEKKSLNIEKMLKVKNEQLDVHELRGILTHLCGDMEKMSRKERLNECNAPEWWVRTGLPYVSVNHRSDGGKKFNREQLCLLIDSARVHYNITALEAGQPLEREEIPMSVPVTDSDEGVAVPLDSQVQTEFSAQLMEIPTPSFLRKKLCIERILEQEDDITFDYVSIMRILGDTEDWIEFESLCQVVIEGLPHIPSTLCTNWTAMKLLEKEPRYKDFIPYSIGNRECLATKADGNCIFNSVALALYGTESKAGLLRLASTVKMAEQILDYSKYIIKEFKDDYMNWVASVSDTDHVPADLTPSEVVEKVCKEVMQDTLRNPFKECSLLHLHFIANLLQRPLRNHFKSSDMSLPLGDLILPPLIDLVNQEVIHLVWIPCNPDRRGPPTHVVPAVCWLSVFGTSIEECAFEGINRCTFQNGANKDIRMSWVACVTCTQKVHTACIRKQDDDNCFQCGCQRMKNSKIKLNRM